MIVVTITMHPRGDHTRAFDMGRITIANGGGGTGEIGNYTVEVAGQGNCEGAPFNRRGRASLVSRDDASARSICCTVRSGQRWALRNGAKVDAFGLIETEHEEMDA